MDVKIEEITPELAKKYLRKNVKNRIVNPKRVEEYARQMLRGEFRTTHQGIAFNKDGLLSDGQHRLLAIVKSGRKVKMLVSRGLDDDDVMAVDRGICRSVRDVFKISGRADDEDGKLLSNQKMISTISQMIYCGCSHMKVSPNDVLRVYEMFKSEAASMYNHVISKAYVVNCTAPALAAGLAAMHKNKVKADAIEKFFAVFSKGDVSGCSKYNVQAAINWRRQLDAMKIKRVSIDRTKMYLGTQNAIWHFVNNTNAETVRAPAAPRYNVDSDLRKALHID